MNLVTEQGRTAYAEWKAHVESIKKEILSSLKNGIDLSPTILKDRYHHSLHDQVVEAFKDLLSSGEINLTDRLHFVLPE